MTDSKFAERITMFLVRICDRVISSSKMCGSHWIFHLNCVYLSYFSARAHMRRHIHTHRHTRQTQFSVTKYTNCNCSIVVKSHVLKVITVSSAKAYVSAGMELCVILTMELATVCQAGRLVLTLSNKSWYSLCQSPTVRRQLRDLCLTSMYQIKSDLPVCRQFMSKVINILLKLLPLNCPLTTNESLLTGYDYLDHTGTDLSRFNQTSSWIDVMLLVAVSSIFLSLRTPIIIVSISSCQNCSTLCQDLPYRHLCGKRCDCDKMTVGCDKVTFENHCQPGYIGERWAIMTVCVLYECISFVWACVRVCVCVCVRSSHAYPSSCTILVN